MATPSFDEFYEKLIMRYGLEHFGVFYGVYRAVVARNDDPERRGRVQLQSPRAGHVRSALEKWVDPSFPFTGNDFGWFFPPTVGSTVFVMFDNGDTGTPVCYWGGWFSENALPEEFAPLADPTNRPEKRGLITRAGHSLLFDDEPGSERVRITWHKPDSGDAALTDPTVAANRSTGDFAVLTFEPDGTVVLANKVGSRVELNTTSEGEEFIQISDNHGNSVTLDVEGLKAVDKEGSFVSMKDEKMVVSARSEVTVVGPTVNVKAGSVFLGDGAAQSVILGEAFQTYFNSHTHATGTGPSGPPAVPMTNALLSSSVKTKT
jgi:uncharacterized protein involved in type VI secretion and phage assembly